MQIIVAQPGLYVGSIVTSIHHTYIHALKLNYRPNGRWVPQYQEAGHAKLQLHCETVKPEKHQEHRRTRGGIERDTRETGGHRGTGNPRDTRGIGGHKRGPGETPGGPEDTRRTQ
jgi:hypothetical protein